MQWPSYLYSISAHYKPVTMTMENIKLLMLLRHSETL